MLDEGQIKAIRDRCEKATAGPWEYYVDSVGAYIASRAKEFTWSSKDLVVGSPFKASKEDSIFMAHAREDIQALLEERDGLIWRLRESNKIAECSFERGSATWKKIADKLEQERDRWKAQCEEDACQRRKDGYCEWWQ